MFNQLKSTKMTIFVEAKYLRQSVYIIMKKTESSTIGTGLTASTTHSLLTQQHFGWKLWQNLRQSWETFQVALEGVELGAVYTVYLACNAFSQG